MYIYCLWSNNRLEIDAKEIIVDASSNLFTLFITVLLIRVKN